MAARRVVSRLGDRLRSLRDERGQVAVMLALSIVPTTFLIGAAMDYSGASHLKQHLQTATDGAGLKLCQMGGSPTQTELETAARDMLASYRAPRPFTLTRLVRTTNPREVTIETRAEYPTAIMRAFNASYGLMPVVASAKCFGEPQTFEIALVLDNTGSMALSGGTESKMASLKTASLNFIDFVFSSPVMKNTTKIAIVPFATSVAVSPTTAGMSTWMDTTGTADYHWNNVSGSRAQATTDGFTTRLDVFTQLKSANSNWGWAGCFESLPYPLNVQDGKPTSSNKNSYYVPLLSPDEPGDGGDYSTNTAGGTAQYYYNSYIKDSTNGSCGTQPGSAGAANAAHSARMLRGCKYKNSQEATAVDRVVSSQKLGTTGPNFACTTRPLTRLTDVRTTLETEINAMQPSGTTNIHEGLMWGWRAISPNSVLADGAVYNKPYNNKIIILMTDGDNTWVANSGNTLLKSFHSALGYYVNADNSVPQGATVKRLSTDASHPASNPTSDAAATTAMDNLTREACANARAATTTGGREKIVIYTIGFSTAAQPIDNASIQMLESCAGVRTRAYVANNSTDLVAKFREIANSIHNLRLTQ